MIIESPLFRHLGNLKAVRVWYDSNMIRIRWLKGLTVGLTRQKTLIKNEAVRV